MDELDSVELDEVIATEDRGVVVQFWGTWCAPCRALKPHLARLAVDYAESWRMVSFNVESDELASRRWDVASVPTVVMMRAGDEVHRFAGAVVPSQIAEKLDQLS